MKPRVYLKMDALRVATNAVSVAFGVSESTSVIVDCSSRREARLSAHPPCQRGVSSRLAVNQERKKEEAPPRKKLGMLKRRTNHSPKKVNVWGEICILSSPFRLLLPPPLEGGAGKSYGRKLPLLLQSYWAGEGEKRGGKSLVSPRVVRFLPLARGESLKGEGRGRNAGGGERERRHYWRGDSSCSCTHEEGESATGEKRTQARKEAACSLETLSVLEK